MTTCCKTGSKLGSCSDQGLNQSFHDPPSGICRSTMKFCCSFNQKHQNYCDKDFILTSFDRFCKDPATKYETCCAACQLGEHLGAESKVCSKVAFPMLKGFANDYMLNMVSDCCDRKKRILLNHVKADNLIKCSSGFYFNRRTKQCEDIDECSITNNGCIWTQECQNTQGSYICIPRSVCASDFWFDASEMSCKKRFRQEGKNEGICVFEIASTTLRDPDFGRISFEDTLTPPVAEDGITMESKNYSVIAVPFTLPQPKCPQGFKVAVSKFNKKRSCVDIDECEARNSCRDPNSNCVNTVGSFVCECRSGYKVATNEQQCVDVDECHLGQNVCDHYCQNLNGTYHCLCPRGFRLDTKDNKTCIDIDECTENSKPCSHNCRNAKGSFRCECPRGFRLVNKKTCVDINECTEKRGVCAKEICNNLYGGYACYAPKCPTNYRIYHSTKVRNDFR